MKRALKKILLLPLLLASGAGAADLRVDFVPQFNGAPVAFDALKNQTAGGQKISITRFDFLLSDVALRQTNGIWIEKKDFFAFISARDGKTNFTLEMFPPEITTPSVLISACHRKSITATSRNGRPILR